MAYAIQRASREKLLYEAIEVEKAGVSEVRAYWEEQNAYEEEPEAKDILAREEYLYAQVEEILDELGEGAEVAIRERVRIARLSPVK